MNWPHHIHRLRWLTLHLFQAQGAAFFTGIAVILFALAFLIVGVMRVVEYADFGFTPLRRGVLLAFHIVGCLAFFACFLLLAIDPGREYAALLSALLTSGFILLVPIQIYIGLLRRQLTAARTVRER